MPGCCRTAARNPSSRRVVLSCPSAWRRTTMRPLPLRSFAMCSPARRPPASLSVATKLTQSSPLSPESKMTTGIRCFIAALTGATSAESSSGASAMPLTPRAMAFSTSLTCESRSSSRSGPRQATVTPSSCAAFSAPAWMLCQNACEVPFGITATVMPPSLFFSPEQAASMTIATTANALNTIVYPCPFTGDQKTRRP